MIKIQNSLQKLELDYLVLSNGESVYFAKTETGAIKQFIKLQKEHFSVDDFKKGLFARHANKEQIESAVYSICENYASRYLRADQLRRSIERYCFVVDFK